jgi:hypothetical protein
VRLPRGIHECFRTFLGPRQRLQNATQSGFKTSPLLRPASSFTQASLTRPCSPKQQTSCTGAPWKDTHMRFELDATLHNTPFSIPHHASSLISRHSCSPSQPVLLAQNANLMHLTIIHRRANSRMSRHDIISKVLQHPRAQIISTPRPEIWRIRRHII